MSIIAKGFGPENRIVVKGYGRILVIVPDDDLPDFEGGINFPFIEKFIETKTVVVKEDKREITVDVLFINPKDQEAIIKVILESAKYQEIKVMTSMEEFDDKYLHE